MPPCLPAPPLRVQVPTRTTHTTTEALAQASQLEGCCPIHARNLTRKCTETPPAHTAHTKPAHTGDAVLLGWGGWTSQTARLDTASRPHHELRIARMYEGGESNLECVQIGW